MKTLKFKVSINGLDDKIYRDVLVPANFTIADLAYSILVSFNSLCYHQYNIKFDGIVYSCQKEINSDIAGLYANYESAVYTKLSSIKFEEDDEMKMEYDFGSTTTFNILYLGKVDYDETRFYPYVSEGKGNGMLDDISEYELKDIVYKTDKDGYSSFEYTPGYKTNKLYDYREYSLKENNEHLREYFEKAKKGYEG